MTAIGDPVIRVDGHAKVTGAAKYSAEFDIPNLSHAVLVTSTIPNGRITSMMTVKAQNSPGVLLVMTPANALKHPQGGKAGVHPPAGRVLSLLQDNTVLYNNQPIGVVVAETLDQAMYPASLIEVKYQQEPPKLSFEAGMPDAHPGSHGKDPADVSEGQLNQELAAAEVRIDQIYTTPIQNHNPMEPHATIAQWDGDKLTLHDTTQYITGVKQTIAKTLGIPEEDVRVICPFTGRGFGCKGSTWSHVVLAAMAAKMAQRPVKLALERPQMFGPVGARPRTHQHVVLAAKHDGTLCAIEHHVHTHTSVFEDFTEPSSVQTRMLYASPAISTSQRLVPLHLGTPTFQRAPGESTGTFALEIAMDELAYKLNIDPIELRLKNYAEKDPTTNKPFSSKHLRECYQQGAERFGWSKRNPTPRFKRRNDELIGWGVATTWGAVFAEVGVEEFTGMVHVHRVVGVYDVGALLNERTGKSQLIGGIVRGVGLALQEATRFDSRNGRPINNNLAEYHVPVNADIGDIEVYSLNIPDRRFNPLGARGIGEIGITGIGAAIAKAIYHALANVCVMLRSQQTCLSARACRTYCRPPRRSVPLIGVPADRSSSVGWCSAESVGNLQNPGLHKSREGFKL